MTPEDLSAVRARYPKGSCGVGSAALIVVLCDALEQAWAETRAHARSEGKMCDALQEYHKVRNQDQMALARVRALCDRYAHVPYGIDAGEVRAALEGDNQ